MRWVVLVLAGCWSGSPPPPAEEPAPAAPPRRDPPPRIVERRPEPPLEPIAEALDRTMIQVGMQAVMRDVYNCGTHFPTVKGTVKILVKVDPSGAVATVTVTTTPDPPLGSCVANALQRATFAPTVNGGSFSYPFVF